MGLRLPIILYFQKRNNAQQNTTINDRLLIVRNRILTDLQNPTLKHRYVYPIGEDFSLKAPVVEAPNANFRQLRHWIKIYTNFSLLVDNWREDLPRELDVDLMQEILQKQFPVISVRHDDPDLDLRTFIEGVEYPPERCAGAIALDNAMKVREQIEASLQQIIR